MSTEVILDIKKAPNKITFGTTVVTFITDPFNPITSRQVSTDLHGRTLDTYLKGYCLGAEYLVKVNGKLFEGDYSSYIVQPNDNIVYVPVIAGGGGTGKQILMIVAMIALTVVSGGLGAVAMTGTFAGGLAGLSGMAAVGGYLIAGGIMMAGSLLINAVLAPDMSSSGISSPEVESSTYSWTGIQTSRDLNTPIPVLYGTHALGGTVINNRFYYKDSDDWLSIQLALCHGEIEKISAEDIAVQDASFSSFVGNPVGSDGYFDYVPGKFDQPIMKGFSDSVYNNGAISRQVKYNVPYTFITESTNIDSFRIHFEFPRGLYNMSKQGKKINKSVSINVKYRKVGTTGWNTLYKSTPVYVTEYLYVINGAAVWSKVFGLNGQKIRDTRSIIESYTVSPTITFTNKTTVALKEYFEPKNSDGTDIILDSGQYEFEVLRITPDDLNTDVYNVSDSHVRFLEEINTSDVNYGGIALLGIDVKATDQLSSQRPNFTTVVTRKPLYLLDKYRDSTNPAWICYDILTNTHYGMGIPATKLNTPEFIRWAEFCNGGSTHTFTINKPSTYVTIHNSKNNSIIIPATELPEGEYLALNSVDKNISFFSGVGLAELADIALDVHDIVDITKKYEKNNPNLADGYYYYISFRYTIKQGSVFSYSLSCKNKITMSTPKLTFNGVMDTTSDVWSAIQEVARIGRGQVILQGTKYSCIYDSIKTVTGLYNSANSNNVTVNYINATDIASELEIQYADKNTKYEMTSVSIQDVDAMASGVRSNKASNVVKGITSEADALIYGRYLLATSKYIRRTITFDADIESITQSVGDLIAVQTDVTQYGKGGLVKSVVGTIVTLDDIIYLDVGKEYSLKVKKATNDYIKDYIFTANVANPQDLLTFNALPSTTVGVITFSDLSLVIHEINGSVVSTNTLIIPEGYEIDKNDRYAFGLKSSDSILCTIVDISRDGDLTRRIVAAEYNESILDFNYDNDILQRIEPTTRKKNTLSNLKISDRLVKNDNNTAVAMVSLAWDSTVSSYYNMYTMEENFKNYLAMGIKGNKYEYAAVDLSPDELYTIYIEDANDIGVTVSKDYVITAFSAAPDNISNVIITTTGNSINFDIIYPDKPLDFSHYKVLLDNTEISKQLSDKFSIPAIFNNSLYNFAIIPVDLIGKSGGIFQSSLNTTPPSISSITYTQEKEYIKFNITASTSSFAIDYFTYSANGIQGTTKDTTLSIIADWVGTKSFTFVAYDVTGKASSITSNSTKDITITVPVPINLSVAVDGKDAIIRWSAPPIGLPIEHYEVEYDGNIYKTKSNQYRLPVYWLGNKTFKVRSVSTLGAISSSVETSLVVAPGTMSSLKTEVIDNNVLLRWQATQGTLPIETFMMYRGPNENSLEIIGEKKGTFTTIFESTSGTYTYWMAPIDSAGNVGTKMSTTTIVNQPPDYVSSMDWNSNFTGTLVNARLENNKVYLPINTSETIGSHFTNRGWTSAQAQVTAGYPLWMEPYGASGSYTEVFDYGAVLSSSMVQVNLDRTILQGSPNTIISISLSSDGVSYSEYYNQSQVYGTGFRYVKVMIEAIGTNAAISINAINVRLSSKILNDAGSGYSSVALNTTSITGNGSLATCTFATQATAPYLVGQTITISGAVPTLWNSSYIVTGCTTSSVTFASTVTTTATTQGTLDQNGTSVTFTKQFIDILSIQVTPTGTSPVFAVYDFVDAVNPSQFKVYLYNTSGTRVSGKFSWGARGY